YIKHVLQGVFPRDEFVFWGVTIQLSRYFVFYDVGNGI
ncbi:MAG: hypothetical protein ACI8R8_003464, partial [Paraglaciecola sp.]